MVVAASDIYPKPHIILYIILFDDGGADRLLSDKSILRQKLNGLVFGIHGDSAPPSSSPIILQVTLSITIYLSQSP